MCSPDLSPGVVSEVKGNWCEHKASRQQMSYALSLSIQRLPPRGNRHWNAYAWVAG